MCLFSGADFWKYSRVRFGIAFINRSISIR